MLLLLDEQYCCRGIQKAKNTETFAYCTVFRIRIRKFLGLPDLDPLVRGTVLDPSINKQKYFCCFVIYYDFLSLINYINGPEKVIRKKTCK